VTTKPSRRTQHVDDTRQALVTSARRLFGKHGFAGTSLDDICAEARVTKGALYHHFRNKEHLFLEVYDQVEQALSANAMAAAIAGPDPVSQLQLGFAAFLDTALDEQVRRIALLDAPSVLGTAKKLEVDARHSLAAVQAAIEVGIADGLLEPLDPEALARLLLSACSQAALIIATASDPRTARVEVGRTLDRLLTGLAPR
jgi:AcrR family transcriptional regulator